MVSVLAIVVVFRMAGFLFLWSTTSPFLNLSVILLRLVTETRLLILPLRNRIIMTNRNVKYHTERMKNPQAFCGLSADYVALGVVTHVGFDTGSRFLPKRR